MSPHVQYDTGPAFFHFYFEELTHCSHHLHDSTLNVAQTQDAAGARKEEQLRKVKGPRKGAAPAALKKSAAVAYSASVSTGERAVARDRAPWVVGLVAAGPGEAEEAEAES